MICMRQSPISSPCRKSTPHGSVSPAFVWVAPMPSCCLASIPRSKQPCRFTVRCPIPMLRFKTGLSGAVFLWRRRRVDHEGGRSAARGRVEKI